LNKMETSFLFHMPFPLLRIPTDTNSILFIYSIYVLFILPEVLCILYTREYLGRRFQSLSSSKVPKEMFSVERVKRSGILI
jgi:hypothetical protein